ncbi:MAG: TIGR01777 family protein [Actinobacteria bacterium]|nr:TIGR01777 family protein [Actinomycetota bacterium]
MKLVVSGASGLLGSALVPALEADGHEVLRLVRHKPEGANEIEWDPGRGSLDADALTGVSAAINVSGATIGRRWTPSRKAEIVSSRVNTTRLLSQTLAQVDPRPQALLSAGGIGIYGDRSDEFLTEESGLGGGFLVEVGKAWEEAAESARAAGIRVVTFRQGVVLTHRGGILERLLTPFKLGFGGQVGSGKQWWSWVSSDDLVEAYRFALAHDISGAVNLVSPNPVTNSQFTKALGRAIKRPTVVPFPAFAAKTIFGEMGEEVLLGSQRALPARLLDAGFTFRHAELGPALERALAE